MIVKIRYLVFLLVCMFIFPLLTNAECNYQRKAELSKIAGNVQFSYNYTVSSGIQYDVHITNLTDDVYIVDNYDNVLRGSNDITFPYSNFLELTFFPGDTVSFSIYSNDVNCKDELLMKKSITLPNYNYYALSEECENYPNFKYCNLWGKVDVDYEKFYSELNKYIQNSKASINKQKKTILNKTISFALDVWNSSIFKVIIFIVTICSLIFLFIKFLKKRRVRI